MRSPRFLALLCAAPLVLSSLGCGNRSLLVSRATPPAGVDTSYTSRMMQLAQRYEEQGNRESALRVYRQIAATDPRQSEARERITAITGRAPQTEQPSSNPPIERATPRDTRAIAGIREASTPVEATDAESPLLSVTTPEPEGPAPRPMPSTVTKPDAPAPRAMPEILEIVESVSSPPAHHAHDFEGPQSKTVPGIQDLLGLRESVVEPRESGVESPVPAESPAWWEEAKPRQTALDAGTPASEPEVDVDETIPEWARTSLARLCPDADEELLSLVRHLEEPDDEVRKEALMYLSDLGADGAAALPAATALLDDPDELIRAHAAWTVWSLGDRDGQSVTALASLTQSEREDSVQLAAFFLGCIGPDARDAEAVLRRARDDSSGATRLHLAEALIRINPGDLVSLNELTRGLQDPDPALRWLSAVALTGVTPDQAAWVVPALTARLSDSEPSVCSAAALTLGSLGPSAHLAVTPLTQATTHEQPDVRMAAEAALACIQR